MPGISAKVLRAPRIGDIRFTRTEMRNILDATSDAEVKRIRSAQKLDLSAANPLKVNVSAKGWPYGYAIDKTKRTGRNRRDWYGVPGRNPEHMLDALRSTVQSGTSGTIKFPASVAKRAAIREANDDMFSLSILGEKAGFDEAQKYIDKALKRAVR